MGRYTFDDEEALLSEKSPSELQEQPHKRRRSQAVLSSLSPVFILFLFLILTLSRYSPVYELYLKCAHSKPEGAKQALELQLPIQHKNLVFEQLVLEHSFGNSWGIPAKVKFDTPTDIDFNRVVLELNTTVDGVQYDRLAHVFIDDVPVWRTSTAEPGNELVFSSSVKDVSKYLQLFKSSQAEMTFQLDNLLVGKLTGAFNTSVAVKYYNEEQNDYDEGEISSFITVTNKPANKVTKLIESKDDKTPLIYYDGEPAKLNIPKISHNTTNLKLSLYASGNAAEEFWYSNALDSNKDRFKNNGHYLHGNGPVRVVDVYINEVKVSSVAPDPVIFTGGISPPLWRPIVGVNAFDIKPIEVDLTAFLPILWKTPSKLEIIISNGNEKDPLKISPNWILAANLLHWETSNICESYGEVQTFDNSASYIPLSIGRGASSLTQIVQADFKTHVTSNLTYVLTNGTVVPLILKTDSKAEYSNVQIYNKFGDYQQLSTVISSKFHKDYYDENGNNVASVKSEKAYPLVTSIETGPFVNGEMTYDANVTSVYGSTLTLQGKEVFVLETSHNGTSTFTLSPQGNHGYGNAQQNFTAELHYPYPEFRIDESVTAVNGTIVSHDRSHKSKEIAVHEVAIEEHLVLKHLASLLKEGVISVETFFGFKDTVTKWNDLDFSGFEAMAGFEKGPAKMGGRHCYGCAY